MSFARYCAFLLLLLTPLATHAQFIRCVPDIVKHARIAGSWFGPENDSQTKAIYNAVEYYKREGKLVTHLDAYAITGFSAGLLFSTGEYLVDETPKGIFESREHFFVLFDQEVHEQLASMEGRYSAKRLETLLKDESSPYYRLKSFHFLRIPMSHRMRPELAEKVHAYVQLRVKQVFGDAVKLAVDELEKSGELFGAPNAKRIVGITYDQLMGTDYYGISDKGVGKVKRVSPRIVDFWRAYYEEVNRRIEAGSENAYLHDFNILDVIFEVQQGTSYFRKVVELFNEARPQAQEKFLTMATDVFGRTGVLFNVATAGDQYGGIAWMRVMGRNEYDPGGRGKTKGGQSHRRVFDDLVEFWVAFSDEVTRIRREWPKDRPADLGEKEAGEYFKRLEEFSLYTVRLDKIPARYQKAYDKACERDHKKDRELYLRRAVAFWETSKVEVDKDNCLDEIGIGYQRLTGRRPYTADRRFGHLAIFESPEAYEQAFAAATRDK